MTNYSMQDEIKRRCEVSGLKLECLGSGSPTAQYIIIAEAPGDTELQMKMPLVGASASHWHTVTVQP